MAFFLVLYLGNSQESFENFFRQKCVDMLRSADHLRHLIIHGFLHLQGYDHQNDDDAEIMEDLERRALARLGVDDPYAA